MKENANMSVTDNVDVKLKQVDPISDILFKKLNRMEEMIELVVSGLEQDKIIVTTASTDDVKKAVCDALMKYHHLFSSKLAESTINSISTDVLNTLKQK